MREGLAEVIQHFILEYQSFKKPFSILLLDIDHFKLYNDKHGHLVGDEVLKFFSSSIRLSLVSEETYPFRLGGDEFVVIFPSKNAFEAYLVSQRILDNVKKRLCLVKDLQLKVSFSGGIACYPGDAFTYEEMMVKADQAMYLSKRMGRGRVTVYRRRWLTVYKRFAWIGLALIALAVFCFQPIMRSTAARTLHRLGRLVPWHYSPNFKAPSFKAGVSPYEPSPAASNPIRGDVTVYLTSGGRLTGNVLTDTGDTLVLQLNVSNGSGFVTLKKDAILRIGPAEKGSSLKKT